MRDQPSESVFRPEHFPQPSHTMIGLTRCLRFIPRLLCQVDDRRPAWLLRHVVAESRLTRYAAHAAVVLDAFSLPLPAGSTMPHQRLRRMGRVQGDLLQAIVQLTH